MINLGNTLTAIRKERGLTQTKVAIQAKISNGYLSEIEKNKKTPDIETLDAICKVLKVPIPILLFKAVNEESIIDPDKKRLVREIKPLFEQITKALYFAESPEIKLLIPHSALESSAKGIKKPRTSAG
jgi:transcriptional regulator with XRE-family HTH domain